MVLYRVEPMRVYFKQKAEKYRFQLTIMFRVMFSLYSKESTFLEFQKTTSIDFFFSLYCLHIISMNVFHVETGKQTIH